MDKELFAALTRLNQRAVYDFGFLIYQGCVLDLNVLAFLLASSDGGERRLGLR